ncbi:MAG: PilN domain-containing protein [Hyphomicrobiales bacterium]|nr:PilN domain-containing protein [Hyphomicrobiales bacterium]
MANMQIQLYNLWFWWKDNLFSSFPGKRNNGTNSSLKINIVNEDGSALFTVNAVAHDITNETPIKLAELLKNTDGSNGHSSTSIELNLPGQLYLAKSQTLPATAKPRIRQILSSGLATNTTMDVEDQNSYLTSWNARPNAEQPDNRINATLFVLKRQLIDRLIEAVEATKSRLATITVDHDGEQINILPNLDHPTLLRQKSVKLRMIVAFIIVTICGSVLTANHIDARQTKALNDLDNLITIAGGKAKTARQKIDERNRIYSELSDLRQAKGNLHSMHGMLERITTALPNHTWLTEIRLQQRNLVLSGFSNSAADIIRPLETVPEFSKVKFTNSIVRSARFDKEQFSLQISVSDQQITRGKQ